MRQIVILIVFLILISCGSNNEHIRFIDKGIVTFDNGFPSNPMLTGVVLKEISGLKTDAIFFVDIIKDFEMRLFDFRGKHILTIDIALAISSLDDHLADIQFIDSSRIAFASWSANFSIINFDGKILERYSLYDEISTNLEHDFELNSSIFYSNLTKNEMLLRLWNSPKKELIEEIPYTEWLKIKYPFDFQKGRNYFIKLKFIENSVKFELGGESYFFNIDGKVKNYLELAFFRVINDTILHSSLYKSSFSIRDYESFKELDEISVKSKFTRIGHPAIEFTNDFEKVIQTTEDNFMKFGSIANILKWRDCYIISIAHEPQNLDFPDKHPAFSILILDSHKRLLDEINFRANEYDFLSQFIHQDKLYIKIINDEIRKNTFRIFDIAY
jgi:hypothetical protein